MSDVRPKGRAGVGLLQAPVAPDRLDRCDGVDEELVDLLCADEDWLDATFCEIVAAGWAEPPRGGEVRRAARPRAVRVPRSRRVGAGVGVVAQWSPRPQGRQRSPPLAT